MQRALAIASFLFWMQFARMWQRAGFAWSWVLGGDVALPRIYVYCLRASYVLLYGACLEVKVSPASAGEVQKLVEQLDEAIEKGTQLRGR